MPKYLVPIDMNKNELQNAVIQNLASAPSNPKKGQFYFNTTDNTLYVYNGNAWKNALNEQGAVNYDNLTNKPITNLSSSSISAAGIYRIASTGNYTAGSLSFSANKLDLVLYNGTKALILSGSEIKSVTSSGTTSVVSVVTDLSGKVSTIETKITNLTNNKLDKNANITAGTHTKITYDAKGLVTGGSNLTASDIPDLSGTYIKKSDKGVANGVATLDSSGLIPSSQLPSYVDDVVEILYIVQETAPNPTKLGVKYYNGATDKIYTSKASGSSFVWDSGKKPSTDVIYVNLENNAAYRYTGSEMFVISDPLSYATESEAKAGTDNKKVMTSLRVKQAIESRLYSTKIGNGTTTSFTITHNLNSRNVIVSIYETASPYQEVIADVYHNGLNTIKVEFATAPTSNQYTVNIIKTV